MLIATLFLSLASGAAEADEPGAIGDSPLPFLAEHCASCHSDGEAEGGFSIEGLRLPADPTSPLADFMIPSEVDRWEPIIRRLRARQMPPPEADRPHEAEFQRVLALIEGRVDSYAARHPRPGRTNALRRLTRVEYANAVRDLLGVTVDVSAMLPKDQSSNGFDNITVDELSPLLLSRYLTAAEKISRLAVGVLDAGPTGIVVRVPQDRTQEGHVAGLPLGTRGGVLIDHTFPQSGEYEIRIRLARDRDEKVEGLFESHELDVLVDRDRKRRFTVQAPGKKGDDGWAVDHTNADAHLRCRIAVDAGPHKVGVTFARKWASLNEIKREPFDAAFNRHRHPRRTPAVYEVSITGPFDAKGPGETPSRRKIFGDHARQEQSAGQGLDSADRPREILSRLVRLAYRRPVTADDLATPMAFFEAGNENGDFDLGIQNALAAILVNPNFLFRVELDPVEATGRYVVDDTALASRLSFFLWSSLPDDELLSLAEAGRLGEEQTLRSQVSRMLADPRASSLVTNFAGQWLYLRNLASATPDLRRFPDFDDNLRHAMRRETELVVGDILESNRSILDLLRSDETYLNERLAKHYEIPHVVGSDFRKVKLDPEFHRGGLLRHASLLTVTSYATRTSPTIRGNWVLENILGTPAPPPPPNVPNLKEKVAFESLTTRERLAVHRENPACASCHNLMDPIGFALDQYDALGRWRTRDGETSLDTAGTLPDGRHVRGVDDLEEALLERPELFVTALVEKLLTYALGRGVEASDGPAIRSIVRETARDGYRFQDIIAAVTRSEPFRSREVGVLTATASRTEDAE